MSPFAQRIAANVIDCFQALKATELATPMLVSSAPAFIAGNPASANHIAFYNNASAAFATATGAVSYSISGEGPVSVLFRLVAATGLSGSSGQIGNLDLGGAAVLGFSTEL